MDFQSKRLEYKSYIKYGVACIRRFDLIKKIRNLTRQRKFYQTLKIKMFSLLVQMEILVIKI